MTRAGQVVPTDRSWVVAPLSASTLPTFLRYYDHFEVSPNFHTQPTLFDPRFAALSEGASAAQMRAACS